MINNPANIMKTRADVIDFETFLARRFRMAVRKILIIEDEEELALYYSTLLEDHGFQTSCAFSAEEAFHGIKMNAPDLIVLDIMMPGKGGLNLFAELKKDGSFRDIPVVIVTGIKNKMGINFSSFFEKLKCRAPEGYIEKPIEVSQFIRTICRSMNRISSR